MEISNKSVSVHCIFQNISGYWISEEEDFNRNSNIYHIKHFREKLYKNESTMLNLSRFM